MKIEDIKEANKALQVKQKNEIFSISLLLK